MVQYTHVRLTSWEIDEIQKNIQEIEILSSHVSKTSKKQDIFSNRRPICETI